MCTQSTGWVVTLAYSIHGGRGLCVVAWSYAQWCVVLLPTPRARVCMWACGYVCTPMPTYACMHVCACVHACVCPPLSSLSSLAACLSLAVIVTATLVTHCTASRTMHVSCCDVSLPLPRVTSAVAVACLTMPRPCCCPADVDRASEERRGDVCCGVMTSSCVCVAAAIPSAL
jgi:hypothetical protein